jgi:translation initiation factor IF-3
MNQLKSFTLTAITTTTLRISRKKFKPKAQTTFYAVNDLIRDPELRIIGSEGEHIGVMPTEKAQRLAEEKELDLVVIQPNTEPPIAKIIDFGRYKYEKEKEISRQKAKAKNVEVKGVRLSVRIAQHDMNVRKDKTKEILESGNKVKVEIILRGREKRFGEQATQVIEQFLEQLKAEMEIKVEQPITRQGGQLTTVIGKA